MILIIGCSIKGGVVKLTPPLYNKVKNEQIDKKLLQRVAEYWHYRKSNDPEKSFEYEYRKLKGLRLDKTYRLYVEHMSRAKITKIEIVSIKKYKEGICLDLKFYLLHPNVIGQKTFYERDCWAKVNENWYHILSNRIIFKY